MNQMKSPGLVCETCEFWENSDLQPNIGSCHLSPPISISGTWSFPLTGKLDWCGQWEPDASVRITTDLQSAQGNFAKLRGEREK